jgi:hypothetical protein
MGDSTDRGAAERLLRGLEQGGMSTADGRGLAETLDPVLVYVIVAFLREVYPASHPASNAVLDRVVALTHAWPALVETSRQGERDPVSGWFASEYSFGDFRGRGAELIALIADKLES